MTDQLVSKAKVTGLPVPASRQGVAALVGQRVHPHALKVSEIGCLDDQLALGDQSKNGANLPRIDVIVSRHASKVVVTMCSRSL